MVILEVTFQNSTKMRVIDDNHVVQAFPSDTPDHAFNVAILPRTPRRYPNLLYAQTFNSRNEAVTVDSVAIAHQERGAVLLGNDSTTAGQPSLPSGVR
jgi:hypothetical protein